jgi:tetratricopeptide (TPR) repeat protein
MGITMLRWQIAWFALVFTLPIAPTTAIAQTASLPADAQAALKKGLAAANEQQWEMAIQNFQDARKIAPDAPEIYYDLGLAESKIPGRELRAVAWFGAYLAATPNAPNTAAVRDLISELQTKSQGNVDRLIKATEVADSLLPDTPIKHNGGILGNLTNKPDQDRMQSLYDVANLWASAGNSANAVKAAHRIGQAGYNETNSLSQIVAAQASAGHIADAIETASSFDDVNESKTAKLAIAAAQAKAGDLEGARATLLAAQQRAGKEKSAYMLNALGVDIARAQASIGDISGARKTAEMMPSPVAKTWAYLAMAEAQIKAGDFAAAQATLAIAQKAADMWNSLKAEQKKARCNCQLSEPQDQSTLAFLELRIGQMLADTGDLSGARSALRIAQKYTKLISSPQSKSSQAAQTAEAQANVGDVAGAQESARLISDSMWKSNAARAIVAAQAKAGDVAGAQRTADLTGDPNVTSMAKYIIADAQAKRASSSSDSTPPPKASAAAPTLPAVSVSDWIRELDTLNTPLFTDLSGSVKAPQQTYKMIYPGSSIDPSETDTKRTFKALVAIAQNTISAKTTIDQMWKRQLAQAAKP